MADETYSDAVASLLEIGVPEYEWPDYPALYGLTAEHIPELIRMATDESTMEEDSSSLSVFRNIHAWRALGQLRAVEAAPALVGLFGWIDKYDDEWADDDLPEAVALIGPKAIPTLSDYIANPENALWPRVNAIIALEEIAKRHPESMPEIADAAARALRNYRENDIGLNAYLISLLSDLKQPDTYSLVEEAFQSEMVDLTVMGDWEDFQVEVGLLAERNTERPNYMAMMYPDLDLPPVMAAGSRVNSSRKEEKKTKAKRKQEKQSRKKNRKKKK